MIMKLELKMEREKTLPKADMIRKAINEAKFADKKFWKLAKDKFGVNRSSDT